MLAKDLIDILSKNPDAVVLINRDVDDENQGKMNFKLEHVLSAFADNIQIENQRFDIAHFSNPGEDTQPVFVISDDPIEEVVRTSHTWNGVSGTSTYETPKEKISSDQIGDSGIIENRVMSLESDLRVSIKKPNYYKWSPQEDITAYELSLCIAPLTNLYHNSHLIDQLPNNAKRHFTLIE